MNEETAEKSTQDSEVQQAPVKRGRGRPKGSKNKPKGSKNKPKVDTAAVPNTGVKED